MAEKAKPKKKKGMQIWKLYKAEGNKASRANNFCPKCGPGHFMAKHKDREVCGKCNYAEMSKK